METPKITIEGAISKATEALSISGPIQLSSLEILASLLEAKSQREARIFDECITIAQTFHLDSKIRKPKVIRTSNKALYGIKDWIKYFELQRKELFQFSTPEGPLRFNLPETLLKRCKLAYSILASINRFTEENSQHTKLWENVVMSLFFEQRINLIAFACPVIKKDYLIMDTENSSYYISDNSSGSLFLRNIDNLLPLIEQLHFFGIPVKLTVILGDNDEEAYIFPVTGTPPDLQAEIVNDSLNNQRTSLENRIRQHIPPVQLRVVRWTKMRNSLGNIEMNDESIIEQFTNEEIVAEIDFMRGLFAPGGYYSFSTGERPRFKNLDDNNIKQIVLRKFLTYSRQGIGINRAIGYPILLQNEQPPLLRTKMLNQGLKILGQNEIPSVYPIY